MPRLIFKCPYIKSGTSAATAHLENYVKYMATRSGVERIDPGCSEWPATLKQKKMVEQILQDFPLSRGMFEYEDYEAAPTRANASEFITRALEDNYDQIAKKDNYLKYIATRPPRPARRLPRIVYRRRRSARTDAGGGSSCGAPRQCVAAHHLSASGRCRPSRL